MDLPTPNVATAHVHTAHSRLTTSKPFHALLFQASYLFESIWLVMVLSVLLVVARAVFVVPFSILHNLMPHADKLSRRDVIIVW